MDKKYEVKYNKIRDSFEIRHYEDLTEEEIIEGLKKIEKIPDEIKKLQEKKAKLWFEHRKISAQIEDSLNYLDVIGRVTHTYNGVPIIQTYTPPTEENTGYGRFDFSSVSDKRRSLYGWVDASLSLEKRLTYRDIWCIQLKDETGYEATFSSKYHEEYESNNGFDIDFLKLIAYEFVVNKKPMVEFNGNMKQWFKIFNRDKAIQNLLNS